jgi:hypothetical protein
MLKQRIHFLISDATAHFGATCKNCDSKSYVTIDETSTYKAQPNENGMIKQTIAKMDCRRCEIM